MPHSGMALVLSPERELSEGARFLAEHGSCICQVLKGRTGCPVVPCDTCIADCVGYVEEELKNRV